MRIGVMLAGIVGSIVAPVVAEPGPSWSAHHLASLTPEQFEHSASVKDDALETVTTISTEPGYSERHGLLRIVDSDNFLRVFVDKTSGAASYQLYQRILNRRFKWNDYELIKYEAPGGLKSVKLLKLGRNEDCSMRRLEGRCRYYETVAVPMDVALLKGIAGTYQPGQAVAWKFRFKAQSGIDHDDAMAAAEVAGLLAAVDDYRRAHHLPGA